MQNTKEILEQIRERNRKVEADKAWEVSIARRAVITIATYFLMVLLLVLIDAPKPWFTALVPAVAFILSTLTMPFLKRLWLKWFYKP